MSRNIDRRLKRLEACFRWARDPISFMIQFVDPQKGVTSTLLIEDGKRVWTNLEEEVPADR